MNRNALWLRLLVLAPLLGLATPQAAAQQPQQVVPCTPQPSTNNFNVICINQGYPGTGNAGYPANATPAMNSSQATTGGLSLPLSGAVGKFLYVCGFSVSPGSATAAITITVQITGTPANMFWSVGAPVTAAGTTGAIFAQTFTPCMPASATNTNITLGVGALGAGGVNQSAALWGYLQ